jgi:hypothetical protein
MRYAKQPQKRMNSQTTNSITYFIGQGGKFFSYFFVEFKKHVIIYECYINIEIYCDVAMYVCQLNENPKLRAKNAITFFQIRRKHETNSKLS